MAGPYRRPAWLVRQPTHVAWIAMAREHLDVLVVGAGLSGVGAGCHLQANCPDKTFAIFEARDSVGGTWDLFRYPGIRSDSDMYTLGYSFKPWSEAKAIADGPSILRYVRETVAEHGLDQKIRLRHRVVSAEWFTADARWTVRAVRGDTGETVEVTCAFLFMCTGYYRYDEPYTPDFPGLEGFGGQIVHPQHWSDDVHYDGKRVVVVGSGATAVTLVPAMAERAAHVTMLQRSPTHIISLPAEDPIATFLRRWMPPKVAYALMRWKNVFVTMLIYQLSKRRPQLARALLRRGYVRGLPAGYDIEKHLTPTYEPWDQRLCIVPDGDLFNAIGYGRASIVTDRIRTFTETGIALESGEELQADLIVTATGLNLLALGGATLRVDGHDVSLPDTMSYKGMMLSGVPNFAFAVGYTNASWTLKCDLTCEYVCRLINHMDARRLRQCTPSNIDPSVKPQPFIDFTSGYVLRSIEDFPKQGSKAPWRLYQNYLRDIIKLRFGKLEDGAMVFSNPAPDLAAIGQPARARRVAA
jgi:cation diffusion facilitator CzcD-associated flavoprotein CzcO